MPGHLMVGYMTLNHVILVRIQTRQHQSAQYRGTGEPDYFCNFYMLVLDF